MSLAVPFFWTALLKILGASAVLSSDNAMLFAITARDRLVAVGTHTRPENLWHVAAVTGAVMAIVLGQRPARSTGDRLAATPHHQAR